MNLTLRRVITFPVTFGSTLAKLKINTYLYMAMLLMLTLPVATAKTNQIQTSGEKLYSASIDRNGNVVALNRSLKVETVESRNSETVRVEAEKQRRAVIARESAANRYVAKVVIQPVDSAKRELVIDAANDVGIPWQLLEAVWQVESGKSWDTTRGSYAGAQGPMQFMSGTWRKYAVDADNDGSANIWSAVDSVHGGARLLAASGANRGDYRSALFSYNHANWYVNRVLNIAYSLGLPQ